MSNSITTLQTAYLQMKETQPKLRIRDLAKNLNTSEAQLVALSVGTTAIKLNGDIKSILESIHSLGKVMALTRNDNAVHERKGVYNNLNIHGPIGTFVNEDIDLRLFLMHWDSAFAVDENNRKSIQFFDKSGEAVHKIYLTDESNIEAYNNLIEQFKSPNQSQELNVTSYPQKTEPLNDTAINSAELQQDWLALKDTHDFFGLLQKHKVTRTQALRLAPEGMAVKLDNKSTRMAIELATSNEVPIMIFVGNRGCIQIHTGNIHKLMDAGPWFNILDPDFNLHLNETKIFETWLVIKPSTDGLIHAIEVYDDAGEMIIQIFGKRKPGIPELESWRNIINTLMAS